VIVAELKDVYKEYPMVKALQGISLKVKEKELLLLMGPSGSGKSTLMHILGVLDVPTKGEVSLMGKRVPKNETRRARIRSESVGFVFQDFGLISSINARDNIMLPAMFRGKYREGTIEGIAEQLGISERLDHYPQQLSGGEKQRVAMARALVNDPRMILADEPTGNLDSKTGAKVMGLLRELADSGKSVVVVTHNPEHRKYADRVVNLRDGKVV
jgi:putative ABC transport system ATP-binding protein